VKISVDQRSIACLSSSCALSPEPRLGALIDKHGMSRRLRALDGIQLAVALHLHRTAPVDHFVCADQDLCTVAILEGLAVIDPQQP
jgi:hypothetical protein